jgi:hypothetical protein
VLAFASIATVINALIRLCCFILLIPSWEGKMPIPERSKNSRGIRYTRGLERECLTWRCRIENGQRPCGPQYKAGHMAAPDQSVKTPRALLPRRRRPHTAFGEIRCRQRNAPARGVVGPQPGRPPRLGAMEHGRADTQRARCPHPETVKGGRNSSAPRTLFQQSTG